MSVSYTLRYRIADSGDEAGWTEVTGVTGTSHALTGLTAGVRYDVEVLAVSGGLSSPAAVAQRSTRCAAPAQPTVLPTGYALSAGDDGTNGGLAASWGTVTGAVSHRLRYRVADGPGDWITAVSPSTGTEVFDTAEATLQPLAGTSSFDVEVAAVNQDGDLSAWSLTRAAVPARIAAGGTVTAVSTGGTVTHIVHTFTTSNTFVLNRDRTVEYLIVAGGGGGGSDNAGGGGGGGVLAGSRSSVTADHPIVVGDGGAPSGNDNQNLQTNGGNSSFSGLTALGGGQGGNGHPGARARTSGGSGGGGHGERFSEAGAPTATGADGTEGQGFNGGTGLRSANVGQGDGGGGGGAGAAGKDAASQEPGDGGIGLASAITGTTFRYGSGGGGGGHHGTTASRRSGAGGTRSGGGGGGSLGEVNGGGGEDGFGGGGGGSATTPYSGGAGGSGTVILRYAL